MQNDSTPIRSTSAAAAGKRAASCRVRTLTGCCVVNTWPLNDASTGTSSPGGIRSPSAPPEHVDTHDVLFRIVQEQGDQLERDDGRQPPGEIAEEGRQVAVRGNRFRDLDEKAQLITAASRRLD